MNVITVRRVEINVHFPEYTVLSHAAEILKRVVSVISDKFEHIGMGDPDVWCLASLRIRKNVAFRHGAFGVDGFENAEIKV